MLLTIPAKETREFISKLAAADVVRIDDELFVITYKAKWADKPQITSQKIEDFEIALQTEYHTFNWWEISNEIVRVSEQEWRVGDNIIAFLGLVPV